jgi:hypothetical protein
MRRAILSSWIGLLGLALLAAAGCTGNDVDDGGGADVLLQVLSLENPAVTEGDQTGLCSVTGAPCLDSTDCDPLDPTDVCEFGEECLISEWSASMQNSAKSELGGTTTFDDVIVQSVTIEYVWTNGFVMAPSTVPLSSTVPAGGAATANFFPISAADLEALVAGTSGTRSANVLLTFRGETTTGEGVSVTAGSQLFVEACD